MRPRFVIVMLLLFAASPPAAARESAAGAETAWAWSAGIDARWLGNVAGGRRTGGVYNSLGTAAVEGDLAALTQGAWSGARLEIGGLWIRGGSVSGQYAGDALVASNIDGFDSIRLYQLFLEQRFGRGRASARLGATTADEEFLSNEYGGSLANSGFGWPAFVSANLPGGGPVWPTAALGARVEFTPAEGWVARAAVYDGDTTDDPEGGPLPSEHGVHWQLDATQGAFGIAEVQRTFGARSTTLRAGAWRHTASFDDVRLDDAGRPFASSGEDPRVHGGLWGVYAAVATQLASQGPEGPALGAWLRGGWTPADRSTIAWGLDAGLAWTGALPARPSDVLSVGCVHAQVSPDLVAGLRDERALGGGTGAPMPDYEQVFELTYLARVHARVALGPDLQWVRHPGLSADRADAWVVGLRLGIE